jgi:zinc protease
MKIIKIFIFFFLVSSFQLLTSIAQTLDFKAPLDIDPDVKIGKLDNGLTYYIRKNHKPENRVYLYLAVNAGSVYENDDQQGLAHFTEHMAFNGTSHFKKNELVDAIEKMGVKFGADLNAHTSFNETVYKLQIPSDKPELVDKGFLILEDWAHNLAFDDTEIDKERGVVREEWRLGLGADDRMSKKYFPILLKGSKYADRLPIGKIDIINNFKHATVKQFYYDWYRPDLMAVVVVGDFDVKTAEQKIKEHFAKMKNPVKERKAIDFEIPDNKEPLIAITTDKEATNSTVGIYFKHNKIKQTTIGDYRRFIVYNLFTQMLNKRYQEIGEKADAPYIYGYAGYGDFLAKTKEAYTLGAAAKENKIDKSLEVLLRENERVLRFGFTQTELDRVKADMESSYEAMEKEADKTETSSFVREYTSNFLTGEPIPGIKNERKYLLASLPTIKLDELNKLAKEFITDNNICVTITAPEKAGIKIPKEAEVLNIIKASKTEKVTAYIDKVSNSPLLENKPVGSKVISRKDNKDFGYTELTFANGVKAVLKPTDFKNDEILFSASSPGGTSLYPDKEIYSASFASSIIDQSGIGNFDNTELGKKLSGKIVSISPYISSIKEGLSGNVVPKDFETLLQLNYLYFTAPRKDTAEFNGYISKIKDQVLNSRSNPQAVYYDSLSKIITKNSPRNVSLMNPKNVSRINLDEAYDIYRDRFADASDFTFFIVGSFKTDELIPMLETYLGGLPNKNRKETWKDVEPKFPDGITDVMIYKGIEPKSSVSIIMKDKFEWSYKNILNFQVLMEVLNIKLREKMREEESEIYGLGAGSDQSLHPKPQYSVTFRWGCDPKNVENLSKIVFDFIKDMQKNGPDKVNLDKVKENLCRERETNVKKNQFWLGKLDNLYFNDIQLNSLEQYKKLVNDITPADIQDIAKKYLTPEHYVRVVLKPEKK